MYTQTVYFAGTSNKSGTTAVEERFRHVNPSTEKQNTKKGPNYTNDSIHAPGIKLVVT